MLAKTPLRDQMIAWIETQDPNTMYDWSNPYRCACAQFASALGEQHRAHWMGGSTGMIRLSPEWARLNDVARGNRIMPQASDWTYGAMLQRLRQASKEAAPC